MDEPESGSRLSYLVYRSGSTVARALPAPAAAVLAGATGHALARLMPTRRRLVMRHLQRVHRDPLRGLALRRATASVFDSYARYWLEAFRMPKETPASIEARMRVEGLEHIEAAHELGHGVILGMPHLGGWDFGGAWLALQGYHPLAVAEVLDPPELFAWFVEWRRRLGIEIVPADRDAGTLVLDALRNGRIVGLISDRDIMGTGIEVEFFGERTKLPGGPATLALRTGAPLLPGAIYFEGREGHFAVIRPPLDIARRGRFREDVTRVTQALAHELEDLIRFAPEQWHLMQPNWPSDPGYAAASASARSRSSTGRSDDEAG